MLVGAFAAYMTHQEQKRQDRPSPLFNLIGYLACTVWPLVAAAALIAAWWRPVRFSAAERDRTVQDGRFGR
ncbi:MAG: hypothetical protein ACK4GC_00440 [Paracoccaceae bacterium]